MKLDSTPLAVRPNLIGQAGNEGIALAIGGVLAFLFGSFLTVLGLVGPCFLLLGPLLVIGGIIAVPFGIWQLVDPTSHAAISRLGRTRPDRIAAVRAIEDGMMAEGALHGTFSERRTMTVTSDWIVIHGGGSLLIARRTDLLHAWPSVTVKTRYGMETSRKHKVGLRFRGNRKEEIDVVPEESADLLALLELAHPAAFIGYRSELEYLTIEKLTAQVDARISGVPIPETLAPTAPPLGGTAAGAVPPPPPAPRPPPAPTPPGPPQSNAPLFAVVAVILALVVGLPTAGFGMMFVGCGGLVGFVAWMDSKVAPLAVVCDGTPVPTASNAAIGPDAGVVGFQRRTTKWDPQVYLLHGGLHEVDAVAEAVVIVCIDEPVRTEVGKCGTKPQVEWTERVRVVRASTAVVLADEFVSGGPAPDCSSREAKDAFGDIGHRVDSSDAAPVAVKALAAPPTP
jgi:hypothetical protein